MFAAGSASAETAGCSLLGCPNWKDTGTVEASLGQGLKKGPEKPKWGRSLFSGSTLSGSTLSPGTSQDGGSDAAAANRSVTAQASESGAEKVAAAEEQTNPWLERMPPANTPLYSHSLMCLEAWLQSIGFVQRSEDPEWWTMKRSDWHAELRLDVQDVYVKYLKSGPGRLSRDIERRWSYGLSRKDLEAAIMGGP